MLLSSLTVEELQIDRALNVCTHLRLGKINLGYREDFTPLGSFLVTY